MLDLKRYLKAQKSKGREIYPKGNEFFNSLNSTPLDEVKVVIIGQDPYHGLGQAHGLSFSVPLGIKIPPSLNNIFKELKNDIGIDMPSNGCLLPWANQGVLLLNSVLSVERGLPGSHANRGWEQFTDAIIEKLDERGSIVFMLWGSYAAKKGQKIDSKRHLVLRSPHPSPLSANRGFFGSKHFSKCNKFLESKGIESINWEIN